MGSLAERMKAYEARETERCALPGVPLLARVDGKSFSRWTRGLKYPYDERMEELRRRAMIAVIKETGAAIGYGQSDELSFVYTLEGKSQEALPYFGGRLQKLVSVITSIVTAEWAAGVAEVLPEKKDLRALFDCRVWEVPNLDEAANALLWREQDATKNSVSMAARSLYGPSELHGKRRDALMDLLHAKGVNWNDYPAFFKRGTFVARRTVPDNKRPQIIALDMPPFGSVTNRVGVILGEDPVTSASATTP